MHGYFRDTGCEGNFHRDLGNAQKYERDSGFRSLSLNGKRESSVLHAEDQFLSAFNVVN